MISGYIFACQDSVEPIADTLGELWGNAALYNVNAPESGACAATYNAGNMTVDGAAGTITHYGLVVAAAAVTWTLVSDPTNPRWTWRGYTSGGASVVVSGTPAATPAVPELGDYVSAGLDYVQAGLTIASNATYKLDKRIASPNQAFQEWLQPVVPIGATVADAVGGANQAYFSPMVPLTTDTVVTTLIYDIGVQSGNIDLGIYSWDGTTMTKVVTLGTTACPAAATRVVANIGDTTLYKGIRYFFAFAADNLTVSIGRLTSATLVPLSGVLTKGTTFPLPATVTGLSTPAASTGPAIYATVSGGVAV